MIENLLNKYINWASNTGWKTFIKAFFLALLYSFLMCLFRSDEWGLCPFYFPLSPLDTFLSPLIEIQHLLGIPIRENANEFIYVLIIFLFVSMNFYLLGKKDSKLRQKAKSYAHIIKMCFIIYLSIVTFFYVLILITGYDCSFNLCGFLQGYR